MNKRFLSALAIGAVALSLGSCNKSSSANGSTTEGNWIKKAAIIGPQRGFAVSFTIGDSVAYVGSGMGNSVNNVNYLKLADFFKFSPNGNNGYGAWTQVKNMPSARYMAAAFSIGSIGYVGTGYDDAAGPLTGTLNDFYAYDTKADNWTTAAPLPTAAARKSAVGFAINGKGYIGTGQDVNNNVLADFWQYDPATGAWTSAPAYPGDKRFGAVAFTSNNVAYVTTGTSGSAVNSGDIASFDGNNWKLLRPIYNSSTDTYDDAYTSIQRTYGAAFVINGWAYLTTGTSPGSSNTWAYNISTDLWEVRTPWTNKGARVGAVAFAIGGKGYIGTGALGVSTTGSKTDNFSQFDPSATYDQNTDPQ